VILHCDQQTYVLIWNNWDIKKFQLRGRYDARYGPMNWLWSTQTRNMEFSTYSRAQWSPTGNRLSPDHNQLLGSPPSIADCNVVFGNLWWVTSKQLPKSSFCCWCLVVTSPVNSDNLRPNLSTYSYLRRSSDHTLCSTLFCFNCCHRQPSVPIEEMPQDSSWPKSRWHSFRSVHYALHIVYIT